MGLTSRQKSELQFYHSQDRYGRNRFDDKDLKLNISACENNTNVWGYAYRLVESNGLIGKKILDLGCGTGKHGVYFAMKGADVYAIDINVDGVNLASRRANVNSANIKLCVGIAEELPYKNQTFDLVFGGDILHHVDVELAGREIARILKPDGKCICVETSARNPIMMLARKYLPGRFGIVKCASPAEKPLSVKDVKKIGQNFKSYSYRNGEGIFLMLDRLFPKNQHWIRILARIDKMLFHIFPFLKYYGYHVVLEFDR